MPNELKTAYLLTKSYQLDSFRDQVIKNCHWTYAQWSNKLHDRTAINPLELAEINKVIKRIRNAERTDIVLYTIKILKQ
jgi:hypothetical protein